MITSRKTKDPVSRKVVLIGCSGTGNNYLPGVESDIENMYTHVLSQKGGSFVPSEVVILKDPSIEQILESIEKSIADYCFVYASCHGYTNERGVQMLNLIDGSISVYQLMNKSPRQLIITDACRSFARDAISGIEVGDEYLDFFSVSYSRELFDYFIRASPPGQMIIHSTKPGHLSYENSLGGHFTQSLLKATQTPSPKPYFPATAASLLGKTSKYLSNERFSQEPDIFYSSGNLQVPFAFLKPAKPLNEYFTPVNNTQQGRASVEMILGISLLVFCIYALNTSK